MKRPLLLTTWLSLMTLITAFFGYHATLALFLHIDETSPMLLFMFISQFVLCGACLIAVLQLWAWKKLGLYVFIGSSIVFFLVGSFFLGWREGIFSASQWFIVLGILYLAMTPVWKKFK